MKTLRYEQGSKTRSRALFVQSCIKRLRGHMNGINRREKNLPIVGKVKNGLRAYTTIVIGLMLLVYAGGTAAAAPAGGDPVAVVNNLSDFIFGLIRAVGLILLGFGIVQIGLSLKSHDPSQRANGFLTLAGGVIITFAKEILNIITG